MLADAYHMGVSWEYRAAARLAQAMTRAPTRGTGSGFGLSRPGR